MIQPTDSLKLFISGEITLEHAKALLAALKKAGTQKKLGKIPEGRVRQPRSSKTPQTSDVEGFNNNESDGAETEPAMSDTDSRNLQLGPAITGGPSNPRRHGHNNSQGNLDLQVSNVYNNPEQTAFDVFYKFLDVGSSQIVDADQGLAVAFQSVVMEPVNRMNTVGDELVTLSQEYGPAMFFIAQLFYSTFIEVPTDDQEENNKRHKQFSEDYANLFPGKKTNKTMMNGFNAFVYRWPHFLDLACFKEVLDMSNLDPDVEDSAKLQYILQGASRDVHALMNRLYQARCDGNYGRSNRDTKLRMTNLESMLGWLTKYVVEKRGVDITRKKAASKSKGKGVMPEEEGTFDEVVAFLLRQNHPLLSKHKGTIRYKLDNPKRKQKKRAREEGSEEDDDDNDKETTSEQPPLKKRSDSSPVEPAAQTVNYGGRSWDVPKDFLDLMLKNQIVKEEDDKVIIIAD
ncbi:hypothetical protein HDU77_000861 [Chytriomyces hyalinus]|nr:hypothetical protein HDU77_000861 [Chytriomyces hyalinus]